MDRRKAREILCERVLVADGSSDGKVLVRLMAPREESGVWTCAFSINGGGLEVDERVCGEDAFQAVTLAMEGIRIALERSATPLGWLSPSEHGFPRIVPMFLPKKYRRAAERKIDEQVRLFGAEARKRSRRLRTKRRFPAKRRSRRT